MKLCIVLSDGLLFSNVCTHFQNDISDAASVGSGISMDMGSDFEVLDECESD